MTWRPAVRIVETDSNWQVQLELLGLSREDVKIELDDAVLKVSGERAEPELAEGAELRRNEIRSGRFERSFELPAEVETEGIQARFSQGLLTVEIPKEIHGPTSRVIDIEE